MDLSVFDFKGIENFELRPGVSVDQLKISLISTLKGPNGFLDPGQRIRENRFDMFFLKFSFVSIFFIRIAKGVRLFLFEYKVSYSGVINLNTGFWKVTFHFVVISEVLFVSCSLELMFINDTCRLVVGVVLKQPLVNIIARSETDSRLD